ncbi:MAG: hypothetical protein ACKO1U_05625, partial [Bacteroidota bacterium]
IHPSEMQPVRIVLLVKLQDEIGFYSVSAVSKQVAVRGKYERIEKVDHKEGRSKKNQEIR